MLSVWKSCCSQLSQRWVFAFMGFMGIFLANAFRAILSVTITEMVIPQNETTYSADNTCPNYINEPEINVVSYDHLYDWDEYTQGIILSSFFWGYTITQFPAGYMSEIYGGKYVLGIGLLISSILTILTPLAVEFGDYTALSITRTIMGLAGGTIYPAAGSMLSKWTVPSEKSRISSVVYAGTILGTVFSISVTSLIIRYSDYGWPQAYYFFGAMGLLWFPLWVMLCYNSPEEHPFISESEAKYLEEEALGNRSDEKPPTAPLLKIFSSLPVWAFVISLFGVDWAFYTLVTDLPKYMRSVMKYTVEDNGYLSSLAYLCMWFNTMASSWLADWLIGKNILSLTKVRKIFATLSLLGTGLFILGASYARCNRLLVAIMFMVAMTMMGSSYPSIMVNAIDLSPNYSGTLMGIANGIASLGGIVTPYIVGVLTTNQTLQEWQVVFWIVFMVATLANLFYLIFGSGEVQRWNSPKDQGVREEKEQCTKISVL